MARDSEFVTVGSETRTTDRLLRPATLAAGSVAVVGFLVAAASTNLALAAGEQPVTLLPAGTAGGSLAAIVAMRAVVVVLVAAAVERRIPRYLLHFLVATGVFWVVVATWQAWLMLART